MEHYYSKRQTSQFRLKKITPFIRGNELSFFLASGVFSSKKLDKGSLLLAESAIIKEGSDVLDLGCGNGIVGIAIAKACPSCNVLMTDINERAVKTSKMNLKLNKLTNAKVIQCDGFENIDKKFDAILFNPPQTAGKKVCQNLIEDSKFHLNPESKLQVVARHNKGGKSLNKFIQAVFGNSFVIQKSGGYRVYANA